MSKSNYTWADMYDHMRERERMPVLVSTPAPLPNTCATCRHYDVPLGSGMTRTCAREHRPNGPQFSCSDFETK